MARTSCEAWRGADWQEGDLSAQKRRHVQIRSRGLCEIRRAPRQHVSLALNATSWRKATTSTTPSSSITGSLFLEYHFCSQYLAAKPRVELILLRSADCDERDRANLPSSPSVVTSRRARHLRRRSSQSNSQSLSSGAPKVVARRPVCTGRWRP